MKKSVQYCLEGIGSVLEVLPPERNLSVSVKVLSSTKEAFLHDMLAMRKDFEYAIDSFNAELDNSGEASQE